MKKRIRLLGLVMVLVGLLVVGYPAAAWLYAYAFQVYQARVFQTASSLPSTRAVHPLTIPKEPPEPHSVVGRLEIPRVNLSVMVLEGDQDRDLLVAAGHIPGTALPGSPGNVAIAGHRDTFFRALRKIQNNDLITFTTPDGSYDYVVESTEITGPSDISVLKASATDQLTLITCYPFTYIGSAPERFIVRARRLSS
jgi:sortase A